MLGHGEVVRGCCWWSCWARAAGAVMRGREPPEPRIVDLPGGAKRVRLYGNYIGSRDGEGWNLATGEITAGPDDSDFYLTMARVVALFPTRERRLLSEAARRRRARVRARRGRAGRRRELRHVEPRLSRRKRRTRRQPVRRPGLPGARSRRRRGREAADGRGRHRARPTSTSRSTSSGCHDQGRVRGGVDLGGRRLRRRHARGGRRRPASPTPRPDAVDPGGAPTTLAASGWPYGIAVDGTHVYWTECSAYTVMKVPLGGGTPVTLASNQAEVWAIAVDATNVYWTLQDLSGRGDDGAAGRGHAGDDRVRADVAGRPRGRRRRTCTGRHRAERPQEWNGHEGAAGRRRARDGGFGPGLPLQDRGRCDRRVLDERRLVRAGRGRGPERS